MNTQECIHITFHKIQFLVNSEFKTMRTLNKTQVIPVIEPAMCDLKGSLLVPYTVEYTCISGGFCYARKNIDSRHLKHYQHNNYKLTLKILLKIASHEHNYCSYII